MNISRRHASLFGLVTLAALGLAARPAHAQLVAFVAPTVVPETAGGQLFFTYTYTIINTSSSIPPLFTGNYVSEFDLAVAPDANLMSITAPTGFIDLYTTGDSEITFQSTDPSTDIPPLGSGNFLFTSSVAANTQAFLLTDLNDGTTESGTTLGPSDVAVINATPEPSSVAAFGIAGVLTTGLILRARRRSTPCRSID